MLKKFPRALRAAVLVAGALAWAGLNPQGGIATLLSPSAAHADTTATADQKLPDVPDYSEGDQNAPIHVIEYASYTCPHCAEFHKDVYPQLKKNYIDTGKVKFTMRAFFFDKYGLWADAIARCGGEMRYYGITDMMFDQQRDWVTAGSADAVVNKLTTIGISAGLTKDQIKACLSDGPMLQAMVAKFQKGSTEDKIDGTPTFIINGKKYNNMSYADFSKILDGLLKK